MNQELLRIDIDAVRSRMLVVRDQQVLLDRDVAALYGVETRIVNQAVRNNPDKFPEGYVMALDSDEVETLRSKILTLEGRSGKGRHSKRRRLLATTFLPNLRRRQSSSIWPC